MKTLKVRQFAKKGKRPFDKSKTGRMMDKQSYSTWKKTSNRAVTSEKTNTDHLIPRTNLYTTKPLLRLNKDFHDLDGIKNAQSESNDLPRWLQANCYEHMRPLNARAKKIEEERKYRDCNIFGYKQRKFEYGSHKFRL